LDQIQISIDYFDKLEYQSAHRSMLLFCAAGAANLMQSDYNAAHYYFKNAFIQCDIACGTHRPSAYASVIMLNIGQAAEGLGKTQQSQMYKTSAWESLKCVLGEASSIGTSCASVPEEHRHMVNWAMSKYAGCCFEVEDFESATILLDKFPCLSGGKVLDSFNRSWDKADHIIRKGACLLKIKNAEPALEDLRIALNAHQELCPMNKHNYFTLECRRLISVALMQQGQFGDAMHELKLVIADVIDKLKGNESPLLLSRCLETQTLIYASLNEYDHALGVWQSILEARKHIFGSVHPMVASAHRDIGRLHQIMCDFDSAADNLILSVGMLQRLFGDAIPSVELVEVCLDLCIAYQEGKRTAMAESMLLKTTQLWSELDIIYVGHPENVKAQIYMGTFYRKTNRPLEACKWHKKALRTCLRCDCKSRSNMKCYLPELIVNIAVDYKMANLQKECLRFYEAAVAYQRNVHSSEGDTLVVSEWLGDMALVYDTLGNNTKADESRTIATNIKLSILGEESEEKEPASSLSLLAEHFEQRGQYQRAIPLRKKAFLQAISDHGSEPHHEVVHCYRCLIDTYLKIGYYEQAQRKNNELLAVFKRKYGDTADHADVASTYRTAGYINHGMSKFDASKRMYEQALNMYTRLGVSKHCNDVVLCLAELAKCLLGIGEKSRAESYMHRAKEICTNLRKTQPCQPDVEGKMHMVMGWACEAFPNFDKALSHYKRAQRLFHKAFGPAAQNEQIAQCLCSMGRTQCILGKYDTGILNLDKSVDMLHILYGDGSIDRSDVFDAYCDLANAHLKGGDPALSLEYYTKVLYTTKQKSGTDKPSLHIAKHLGFVAYAAHKAGEYETAVKNALDAANIYLQVLKKYSTHPDTVAMMTLAGDVYMDMGQMEKALRQYKEAAHMVLLLHNGNALSKEVERAMLKVRKARLAVESNTK
jgi:tetratricopeptide (TPR) repeat protein